MEFVDDCIVDSEEQDLSTQLLQMQKKLFDLQKNFEGYCNVLPVLGFNSAKYDLNLIKSHLLPILVNERDNEPVVIKKANQFVSIKIGDIQLWNSSVVLQVCTLLSKPTRPTKKGFLPYEWFDCTETLSNKELPPYDSFFHILRKCNPLEKNYNDFENLVQKGLSIEQAWAN